MNKMQDKAVKLIVRGRVQGVGYRASIYGKISDKLPEIKGYVKNLANGDVEIIAIGNSFDLKKVVDFAYEGSLLAKVESVEVIEFQLASHSRFSSFSINYE